MNVRLGRRLILGIVLVTSCKNSTGQSKSPETSTKATVPDPVVEQTIDAGPLVLAKAAAIPDAPLGLPKTPSPAYNPTTPDKVVLGELLFFDPRLSADSTMSCSSCHALATGWANPLPLNDNAPGMLNKRHAPSLWNIGYQEKFYWDGRAEPLEATLLGHWKGQLGVDPQAASASLAQVSEYVAHFERAFAEPASRDRSAEALAAFVRTLRSGDSPWDRYEAGDGGAVSTEAIAGAKLFNGRAGCAACHPPPLYTDKGFHSFGLPDSTVSPDVGRFAVSHDEKDRGAFKTPGLRDISQTAPYLHNGSVETLQDVIAVKVGKGGPKEVPALNENEIAQLVAFLTALTGNNKDYRVPTLPKVLGASRSDGGIVAP